MRTTIRLLLALALVGLLPVAAFAAEEPYTGGTTPDTTAPSEINAVVAGLTVTLSVAGETDCTWDFGDGETGEGNPVEHTYAEEGRYSVTATCGDNTYTMSVTVGSLSTTGTEVSTYLFWGGGLLLAGLAVLGLTRRPQEN